MSEHDNSDTPKATSSCSEATSSTMTNHSKEKKKIPCIIVLGMAGAGKTRFVERVVSRLYSLGKPYTINLDPACGEVPFPTNIDIRDSVHSKDIMKQFKLGPNCGIVTTLNLFSMKFHQVIELIDKASEEHNYVILDTPGQLEVFTWSASGMHIMDLLASNFPTIITYVLDTARSVNPNTFMSNMLQACSILYRYHVPFIVVMNKIDLVDHSYAVKWMQNHEAFKEAVNQECSMINDLNHSISLVLDKFYEDLKYCGVSAVTGAGIDEYLGCVEYAIKEYETDYNKHSEEMKIKSDARRKKMEGERLKKTNKNRKQDIKESLIIMRTECYEGADIYLEHAFGSSSEDEETDKKKEEDDDEEEVESFKHFLQSLKIEDAKEENNQECNSSTNNNL